MVPRRLPPQRTDDGALTVLGAAAPGAGGVIAPNGGGAPMEKRRGLRRARLKMSMSFSHLILHLDHPEVKAILSKAPYLGNGPLALDYLGGSGARLQATRESSRTSSWSGAR